MCRIPVCPPKNTAHHTCIVQSLRSQFPHRKIIIISSRHHILIIFFLRRTFPKLFSTRPFNVGLMVRPCTHYCYILPEIFSIRLFGYFRWLNRVVDSFQDIICFPKYCLLTFQLNRLMYLMCYPIFSSCNA